MLSTNLKEISFAFLDVETTGLDPYAGDKICELAILKTRAGEDIDQFNSLINPGMNIPLGAVAVNGITNEMVRRAPFFRDVAWNILKLLDDSVVVAHNALIDLRFLLAEFSNLKLSLPDNDVIDTLGIARRFYNFPSNSLGQIARYLGLPVVGEHRAFGDARLTRDIFEYFLFDLDRRGLRIDRLRDLLKLQGAPISLEATEDAVVLPPSLEEALRTRGKIQIKYLSAYTESTSTRIIEPLEMNVNRGRTYIVAYCHSRKERCSFRLDRILEAKNLQEVNVIQPKNRP